MLGAQSRVMPEVRAEVCGQSLGIAPQRRAKQGQSQQRCDFGGGEDILNQRAGLEAKDIDDGKKDHQQNRDKILSIDPDVHVAQDHGPDPNGRNLPQMQNPMGRRNGRKEHAKKFAEGHAHRGDRAGLDYEEQRPAVEKSPKRSQSLAQINVLPPGPRHHRSQFAIAERGNDRHESGDGPCRDQQGGRVDFAGNVGRHNKDAGADHRPHDQHGGAGQAQAFDQFLILLAMDLPITAGWRLGCGCTQGSSVAAASRRLSRWRLALATRSHDFTPRCGKIPLLICAAPVTSRISPQPSLHPRRSRTWRWRA